MNGIHAQRQIDELKSKLNQTQDVVGLLTAWLISELGEKAVDQLLEKLNEARVE